MPIPKNVPEPPKNLNLQKVTELKEAIQIMLPTELGLSDVAAKKQLKTDNYSWQNPKQLSDFILDITDQENIKYADYVLSQWQENFTEIPEYQEPTITELPPANRPSKGQLEVFQKEKEEKEAEVKEIEARKKVETAEEIERREKAAEQRRSTQKEVSAAVPPIIKEQLEKVESVQPEVQGLTAYAKIIVPPLPILSKNEKTAYASLKSLAEKTPHQAIEDFSAAIQESLPSEVRRSSTPEEVAFYADTVATQAVVNLREPAPPPPDVETAVLASAATEKDIVEKFVSQPGVAKALEVGAGTKQVISQGLNDQARLRMFFYQAPSSALDIVVGPNVRKFILGPSPADIQVTLQKSATGATHELDFGKLNTNYQKELQNPIFSYVEGVAKAEIKGRVIDFGKKQLLSKLSSLPPKSALGKLAATREFQGALSLLKPYTSFEFVGARGLPGVFGRLVFQFSPQSTPLLSALGNFFGIDFGIVPSAALAPAGADTLIITGSGVTTEAAVTAVTATGAEVAVTGAGVAAGEIAATGVGVAAGEAAGAAAGATAGAAGGAAAGAAAGTAIPIPVVGTVIGAVVGLLGGLLAGIVGPKAMKKIKENQELVIAIPTAIIVYLFAGPTAGVFAGIGSYGLTSFATRGVSNTFTAFLGGVSAMFALLGRFLIGSFLIPAAIVILVFPVVVALIIFIINSGAYVVPPSNRLSDIGADNPYMLVTKTADPSKLSNNGPKKVAYTVTITALKSTLSNIKIVGSECTISKKSGGQTKCPKEIIPTIPPGLSVSPSSPYSLDPFLVEYDQGITDSLIYDSITMSADTPEEKGITTTGSATVCVGDCAVKCINVSDNYQKWPSSLRSNLESAVGTLGSKYSKFVGMVCKNNKEVNLCYAPPKISPGYFAWHVHTDKCDVYFNEKGVGSAKNSLFMIGHELTHHIQVIDTSTVGQYRASGGFAELSGKGFCTYKDTAGSITESMAEADGLYAAIPSWGGCVTNYRTQYPKNYIFAKGFME